jgi:hypothetical protein
METSGFRNQGFDIGHVDRADRDAFKIDARRFR